MITELHLPKMVKQKTVSLEDLAKKPSDLCLPMEPFGLAFSCLFFKKINK